MNDPQPFPVWIFVLFPLFFAAVWLLVAAILATVGGWAELARQYRDPGHDFRGNIVQLPGSSLSMRRGRMPFPANYKHCVTLTLPGTGLHLRVMSVFRFRHPPLFIPWGQMERVEPGSILRWRTLTLRPAGSSTRIYLWGRTARVVEDAWQRHLARARPAPA